MSEPADYSATCYGSIEELRGKVTDTVCDASGQRIEPFAILGCLKETLGPAQYRLVCLERGLFVLQYRPARSAPIELDAALKGLRDIVGEPIKVIAQQVPAIHRETSGKLRPIINLSTIEGKGREQLLRDLNLAELQTAESTSLHKGSACVQKIVRDLGRRALEHDTRKFRGRSVPGKPAPRPRRQDRAPASSEPVAPESRDIGAGNA